MYDFKSEAHLKFASLLGMSSTHARVQSTRSLASCSLYTLGTRYEDGLARGSNRDYLEAGFCECKLPACALVQAKVLAASRRSSHVETS